ncbi:hypothetical protein GCM10027058_19690 [Microbacterium neimengense]
MSPFPQRMSHFPQKSPPKTAASGTRRGADPENCGKWDTQRGRHPDAEEADPERDPASHRRARGPTL